MAGNKERYTELFLDEAAEHIENLNTNLLLLEKDHSNTEIINEIFRSAHTLKSSAAFVGLDALSKLAHKMEDLFQKVREGSAKVDREIVDLLFACLDRIKQAVGQIQANEIPTDNYSDLIGQIESFHASKVEAPATSGGAASSQSSLLTTKSPEPALPASMVPTPSRETPVRMIQLTAEQQSELARQAGKHAVFHGFVSIDEDAPMKNMRFLLLLNKLGRVGTVFISEPGAHDLEEGRGGNHLLFIYFGDERKENLMRTCQVDMVEEVLLTEMSIRSEDSASGMPGTAGVPERRPDVAAQETHLKTRNIKVSSEKIDYLLNNVGELVITNSGLLKIYEDLLAETGESPLLADLKSRIDQAGRIARDLQTGIMKTRMIPIGIVFQRFNRPVRDLALSLDKEVELVIEGEDTELDKNIIDALNDPLLHLIRNALDHGLESPEERRKAGKEPVSQLMLKAYQSGNSIYVEIRDDGRGLNRQAILDKAVQSGLVPPGTTPSDDDIYNFIFAAGFSTARQVSNLSGRGVGMNVVRKMVSEFKGTVQIQNYPGQGCAFILTFPLTLAIISAILVRVQGEDYAFPLSDVVETIRITKADITRLQGKSIINLRSEIVPIFRLGDLMGLSDLDEAEEFPVVIASVSERKIGYIVDQMVGKKEIVIKSLEQNYRRVAGLIGACLMGDGSIVMVLDVHSLMDIANRYHQGDRRLQDSPAAESAVLQAVRTYNDRVKELAWMGRKLRRRDQRPQRRDADDGHNGTHRTEVSPGSTSSTPSSLPDLAGGMPTSASIAPVPTASTSTPGPQTAPDKKETGTGERPRAALSFHVPPAESLSVDLPVDTRASTSGSSDAGLFPRRTEPTPEPVFEEKLEKSLTSFSAEVENRLDKGLEIFGQSGIPYGELSDADYRRLYSVINTGMINGGLVLSQLLGVSVEVTVPEFQTIHYGELQKYLPEGSLIGVFLETEGEFHAMLMLVFDEETGYGAAGELMGISAHERNRNHMSIEDVQSVLSELTNIVGSSLLNELANHTSMAITPTVPKFIHGKVKDLIGYIDQVEKPAHDSRFLYISTDFLREDTELLGRLFMLPNRPDFVELVKRIQ